VNDYQYKRDKEELDSLNERAGLSSQPSPAEALTKLENSYVAWLCFRGGRDGQHYATVHTCDSNFPGAFKVYRWEIVAEAIAALRPSLTAKQPEYPKPCGLCPGNIESREDLEWHGLGNCVPICDVCCGSGIMPDADKVKESYDKHSVGIIKNLTMLVRRLCYKNPKEKLVTQALNYLRGEGLQGDVLRGALTASERERIAAEARLEEAKWWVNNLSDDLLAMKVFKEHIAALEAIVGQRGKA
jgi:hypothetical protein